MSYYLLKYRSKHALHMPESVPPAPPLLLRRLGREVAAREGRGAEHVVVVVGVVRDVARRARLLEHLAGLGLETGRGGGSESRGWWGSDEHNEAIATISRWAGPGGAGGGEKD